jgi:hypothetical protein
VISAPIKRSFSTQFVDSGRLLRANSSIRDSDPGVSAKAPDRGWRCTDQGASGRRIGECSLPARAARKRKSGTIGGRLGGTIAGRPESRPFADHGHACRNPS